MGIFDKGVKKTNEGFFKRLSRAIVGKSKVDDSVLDAIEEALISSDMGVDTTLQIIDKLEERVEKDKYLSMEELVGMLREEIAGLLDVDKEQTGVSSSLPFDFSHKPYVILVVGVNGVGKTTTIGPVCRQQLVMGPLLGDAAVPDLGLKVCGHPQGQQVDDGGVELLVQGLEGLGDGGADFSNLKLGGGAVPLGYQVHTNSLTFLRPILNSLRQGRAVGGVPLL